MTTIFHNSRCGKSRETLKLLQQKTVDIEIVEYLKTPPTEAQLTEIVKKLKIKPEQLIRKGEEVFKEKFTGMSGVDKNNG
jgi:arsenate reductase (glutaredoxin)